MKLKNNVKVKNAIPILISYAFLGSLVLGLCTMVYLNFMGTDSLANNNPRGNDTEINGKVFRILQNGKPVDPVMGVAVNTDSFFEVQIKNGIDLKKVSSTPLAAEISVLRGGTKISTISFNNLDELKSKNLHDWINSNYQPRDKISFQLLNSILDSDQSAKVFSLASVY